MRTDLNRPSSTFTKFFDSETTGGVLLVICTALALALANSSFGTTYAHLWEQRVGGLRLEEWVNDGLMAIFFLLIGLELERELYGGELADPRRALLPVIAALGGMIVPASIHFVLNANSPTRAGAGIPMATDIAFALGVLAVLGSRVPVALRVFVVAFAVMDDLGAIIVIAVFYTADLTATYLAGAVAVWGLLLAMNRYFRIMAILPYAVGGVVIWWLLLRSGVHATLAGVVLAFAIPYSAKDSDVASPSHKLEVWLNKPVAYIILPLFALANTGVLIEPGWMQRLGDSNSLGIILGLFLGKPAGVAMLSYAAVASGLCRLPSDVNWRHVVGAGMLGGIGFTMSIFITNLAFADEPMIVSTSKLAILFGSFTAGVAGYVWLRFMGGRDGMAAAASMPDIVILPLAESQVSDAALEALLRATYVDEGYTEPVAAETMFRATAVKERGRVLVARSTAGALVGTVTTVLAGSPAARLAAAGEAEMHLLCVDVTARGLGIGRLLGEEAMAVARRAGAVRILLWTQPTMQVAQRLYAQLGFERVPSLDFARGGRQFLVFACAL